MEQLKFTKIILDKKPFQKKKIEKDITLLNLRQILGLSKDIDFSDEDFPIAQVDEAITNLSEIIKENTIYLITNRKDENNANLFSNLAIKKDESKFEKKVSK